MSLIVYECERPEYPHELRQWKEIRKNLLNYYRGKSELALLIINYRIADIELDGLLIKEDAIIIIELKDRSGKIIARMNGDWECDDNPKNPIIEGGSYSSVFKQIATNKRILRNAIRDNHFFQDDRNVYDIQGLVVFTKIDELTDDFDRDTKSWLHITDVENIGLDMHDIKSRPYPDYSTQKKYFPKFTKKEIFDFIRNIKIAEKYLYTNYSSDDLAEIMPSDLYNANNPHNGDDFIPQNPPSPENIEDEKLKKLFSEAITEYLQKKWQSTCSKTDLEITFKEKILAISTKLGIKEIVIKYKNYSKEKNTESKITKSTFNIDEKLLDDDQFDILEQSNDKNMLITGPAGCGKSLIATYKAKQLRELGYDVILIAFTKSLNKFMQDGNEKYADFFYHYQWRWKIETNKNGKNEWKKYCPQADYVIVDEIQDFDEEEIEEFVKAAKKHFFFFGDTAQSIMNFYSKKVMTVEKIAEKYQLTPFQLYSNYRLPKSVARITQDYIGIDVNKYSDKVYKSKENTKPKIISYPNIESEKEALLRIIKKHQNSSIGILLWSNEQILEIRDFLNTNGIRNEFKYNEKENKKSQNTLNFQTCLPKILTFHSAKGLQFQTVIIPFFQGANDENAIKALYVAMTRTLSNLYILHHEKSLAAPLDKVPKYLYLDTE